MEANPFDEPHLARILQEILTGRRLLWFREQWVAVRFPSAIEYQVGLMEYERALARATQQGIPRERDVRKWLQQRELWTDQEGQLAKLEEQIQQTREKLADLSERVYPIAKRQLIRLEVDRDWLQWQRAQFFEHTAEHHASVYRARYLLPFCVRDPLTDQPLWRDYGHFAHEVGGAEAHQLLQAFLEFLGGYETRVLRYLARGGGVSGHRWRMIWTGARRARTPLFAHPVSEWNVNQLQLVYWTSFYDSVYEHFERPPQRIIDNDALLDQWVEAQQREMEERAQKHKHSVGRRAEDYDEVIVFGTPDAHSLDDGMVKSVGPKGLI